MELMIGMLIGLLVGWVSWGLAASDYKTSSNNWYNLYKKEADHHNAFVGNTLVLMEESKARTDKIVKEYDQHLKEDKAWLEELTKLFNSFSETKQTDLVLFKDALDRSNIDYNLSHTSASQGGFRTYLNVKLESGDTVVLSFSNQEELVNMGVVK